MNPADFPTEYLAVGLPHGGWPDVARAAWQPLRERGAGDCASLQPAQALERARREPHTRFVVWVEPPAAALARGFDPARAGLPPATALQALQDASLALLTLVLHHPARCCVVALDEALAQPAALTRALARHAGVNDAELPTPSLSQPPHSALAQLLAERWVRQLPALVRHHEQLQASCLWLDDTPEAAPAELDPGVPAETATRDWQQLQREAARAQPLQTLLDQARSDQARLQALARQARQHGEQLTEQLHRTQEGLEQQRQQQARTAGELRSAQQARHSAHQAHQAAIQAHQTALQALRTEVAHQTRQSEADRAELEQQLQHVQGLLAQRQAELAEARRTHEQARAQATQARQQAEARQAEWRAQLEQARQAQAREHTQMAQARALAQRQQEALQAQIAALRQEADAQKHARQQDHTAHLRHSDLLQRQLHQVQEELEHHHLARRDLEARLLQQPGPLGYVHHQSLSVGAPRDLAPHRELDLAVTAVRGHDRYRPRLNLRLVEHHGRAGLALLHDGQGEPPLMAWRPDGREGALDYMLMIPDDGPSRERLQQLGSGDWQFLGGLARAVSEHLTGPAGARLDPRWPVLAQRVTQRLEALPERFRFDRLTVCAESSTPQALRVDFHQVMFGARTADRLSLRWQPADATVALIAPDSPLKAPLLSAWPMDERGLWADPWLLPLGGQPRPELERAWHAMNREDRDLLLAVLDAMPAVAARAAEQGLTAAAPTATATHPLQRALRLFHGSRLRRVWRAARGRLSF